MANTITRRTALSLALQALAARAALARTGPTPFNLETLRMPIGDQVADVLPVTVGGFQRGRLPDGMRVPTDEALHVRYQRGSDVVIVDATLPATAADARAAVEVAAQETRDALQRSNRRHELPRIVQDLRGDPAYVALGEFVAWSRGRYFFALKASTPHALAAFMKGLTH